MPYFSVAPYFQRQFKISATRIIAGCRKERSSCRNQLIVARRSASCCAPCSCSRRPPSRRSPPASADARLRALYTEEWKWRQQEIARSDQYAEARASDRFPRVDPASQQARLAYWTKTLATLDAIPFDQLSAEEKVNAQVFRTSIRALANDVRFRTYEAPFNSDTFFWTEFTPRQGFATLDAYRAYLARLRDVPRYFDEQIANMRAGLARGFTDSARVGRRPRQDDRAVREGRHDQPAVRALHADAVDHRRERPGRAPRGSGDRDPGRRRTGVRASCSR